MKYFSGFILSVFITGCALFPSDIPKLCIYDLVEETYSCLEDAISFFPGKGELEDGRGLLRIDMTDYSQVVFDLVYVSEPQGFSFTVGDSITNNGWGGDNASQSRDAELMIYGQNLIAYSSDHGLHRSDGPYMPDGTDNRLVSESFVYNGNDILRITVGDEYLSWSGMGITGELESEYLFALTGQDDYEGFVNNNIFIGLNHAISDSDERTGEGLARVSIQLIE